MGEIILYHGSNQIVERPELGKGKPYNDYGQGFYCTAHRELACEWASKNVGVDGFVNEYRLDTTGLTELDLTGYSILHWMTMLVQHRTFTLNNDISVAAKEYLIEHFSIDTSGCDIISGYRADDSYFSFAADFLNNTISIQLLAQAMKLGELGIQHVLVSERAFEQLAFVRADVVNNQEYHARYSNRDNTARSQYKKSRKNGIVGKDDVFIADLVRGSVDYGNIRL